jgi:hypothetical protein
MVDHHDAAHPHSLPTLQKLAADSAQQCLADLPLEVQSAPVAWQHQAGVITWRCYDLWLATGSLAKHYAHDVPRGHALRACCNHCLSDCLCWCALCFTLKLVGTSCTAAPGWRRCSMCSGRIMVM